MVGQGRDESPTCCWKKAFLAAWGWVPDSNPHVVEGAIRGSIARGNLKRRLIANQLMLKLSSS